MTDMTTILGVDIGSISLSMAELNGAGDVKNVAHEAHNGDITGTLRRLLERRDLTHITAIATTTATPPLVNRAAAVDTRVAYITAARRFHPGMGSLLIVGGEKFGLVLFDEEGAYLNYRSNTSCAAGTGSFLDQQAKRLNLSGIQEFSRVSYENTGTIPKIASRCAVFAKTDLTHAQQEGYSLAEICDGLSFGLAKNVADALFAGITPRGPMVFAGGVSLNQAVVKHIAALAGVPVITGEYAHVYGAIGAALHLIASGLPAARQRFVTPADIIIEREKKRRYHYDALTLQLSSYPDFTAHATGVFNSRRHEGSAAVEVDRYRDPLPAGEVTVYLGIDIGSTSTKAALVDEKGEVLLGLYTRTAGRPVIAVQTLFEAIDELQRESGTSFTVLGAGTTGSGRKFIAEIAGADLALDEISAHARAARELDPAVDTIIEIGGQDSKFTTMRNGMVTFSVMNNVCAAGTGSFIEEQAKKLDCALADYAHRAEGKAAPMASDRCTVFMERDLNYYLSEGYAVDEILAAVLHSVRDNYLTKVALEKNIGERIFFQGATAKNRALVAAFEQRLGKPILVSRYCHLTGALGVALTIRDEGISATKFRGLDLYRRDIPVRTEVCDLCANHCKIRLADVKGSTVAFGFLCGRDYDTKKFVKGTDTPDLIAYRNKIVKEREQTDPRSDLVIGLPAALHLVDELPLWKKFFELLGIRTVTSEGYRTPIADGKNLTGAEFCAPVTALHGHVHYLADKADYVFIPEYMELRQPDKNVKRTYCYYTQYAPPLISLTPGVIEEKRVLKPVIRSLYGTLTVKHNLYRVLKGAGFTGFRFNQVSQSYDEAHRHLARVQERLRDAFARDAQPGTDIKVLFLGRPYAVLSRAMNNGIPDIFARMGIPAFYQDMLTYGEEEIAGIEDVLRMIHWHYGAKVLEATAVCADKPGLYPVFITSFKCTPDSYVVEFFKRILDRSNKPYLILQLDEHDSSVGYETRIEAAVRSFRNHYAATSAPAAARPAVRHAEGVVIKNRSALAGKTLLFPNWDPITNRLLVASHTRDGLDVRLVTETPESILRSMRFNTGQCVPLNAIAQNYIDYVAAHGLDPRAVAVWMPESKMACNIGMFSLYMKKLLEAHGHGMEHVMVYSGDMIYTDLSIRASVGGYLAFMFGGMIRKMGCHIRPYENVPGSTDAAIERSLAILVDAFLTDRPKEEALEEVIRLFEAIPVTRTERPKVAIFGDLYVRDNDVMNQDLVRLIEKHGGEVITTPYNELIRMIADPYIKKWFKMGLYADAARAKALKQLMPLFDRRYGRLFKRVVGEHRYRIDRSPEELMAQFNIKLHHTGESMENIIKLCHLAHMHPDLALFVQTNPSYCCPSLVSEAMAERIEQVTGVPVVTLEYDGTSGSKNEDIIPYLTYRRQSRGRKATTAAPISS